MKRVLDLPYGVPGKDVLRRVPTLVGPAEFQACFACWRNALRTAATAIIGASSAFATV